MAMANSRHIALGTISFTVCFAAWGLIGAFAPRFREVLHLTQSQTALLVAVPVLLGSLARIPMGMLTDRFGGRIVFATLLAAVARAGLDGAAADHVYRSAGGGVLPRAGGLFVRHRRGIRLAMDAAGAAGQRAGRLRTGKHRPIRRGISRPGAGGARWNGGGLSRRRGAAGGLGGGVRPAGAQAPAPAAERSGRASARCSRCSPAKSSRGCWRRSIS